MARIPSDGEQWRDEGGPRAWPLTHGNSPAPSGNTPHGFQGKFKIHCCAIELGGRAQPARLESRDPNAWRARLDWSRLGGCHDDVRRAQLAVVGWGVSLVNFDGSGRPRPHHTPPRFATCNRRLAMRDNQAHDSHAPKRRFSRQSVDFQGWASLELSQATPTRRAWARMTRCGNGGVCPAGPVAPPCRFSPACLSRR